MTILKVRNQINYYHLKQTKKSKINLTDDSESIIELKNNKSNTNNISKKPTTKTIDTKYSGSKNNTYEDINYVIKNYLDIKSKQPTDSQIDNKSINNYI